jgi:hypothetical protein
VEINRASEVIVQLRPVRRARLGPDWLGFYSDIRHRLRIAEERTANQRIMTASLTARLNAASTALTARHDPDGARPAGGLLSALQREFLAVCTGVETEDDRLTLLGPIVERCWRLRRYDLDFLVRRWTAPQLGRGTGLDMMDLERPSSEADAPFLLPALRSAAHRQGTDTGEDVDPVAIRAVAAWISLHRR